MQQPTICESPPPMVRAFSCSRTPSGCNPKKSNDSWSTMRQWDGIDHNPSLWRRRRGRKWRNRGTRDPSVLLVSDKIDITSLRCSLIFRLSYSYDKQGSVPSEVKKFDALPSCCTQQSTIEDSEGRSALAKPLFLHRVLYWRHSSMTLVALLSLTR